MALAHSVDEALDRFELIQGTGSLDENRGCAMTVLSWMAGESWTDSLPCTNTVLRANVIAANDANNATSTHRAEMVRAGVDGILDTWWVPDQVVAWGLVDKDTPYVDRVIAAVKKIAAWKVTHDRPNLGGANLGGANLGGADANEWTTWPVGFAVPEEVHNG